MGNVSANTETKVCIIDCSGTTKTVTTPHPIFSDLSGGTVTQLNLIELGGQNGLYS
jgi:hypothetical protein